jgi:hypothetical protein
LTEERMKEELPTLEIRATVLGHVVQAVVVQAIMVVQEAQYTAVMMALLVVKMVLGCLLVAQRLWAPTVEPAVPVTAVLVLAEQSQ